MKWFIYNILFTIAYWVMMPKFLLRMCRRGGYANRFADRLGYYPAEIKARLTDGTPRVWVHAVSVGEVTVAKQIMHELRSLDPSLRFVLSTTSSTGWKQAEENLDPNDILIHNPVDYPGSVKRALRQIRPTAHIITETEIWPNTVRYCHKLGIPIYLINARISDRSAPGYRRLRCWFGQILNLFTAIMAQSDTDKERLVAAGCKPDRITVTGSMKFDVAQRNPVKEEELCAYLAKVGFTPTAPILLGGSTWPNEDAVILRIYARLKQEKPSLRLVIAPRHFEKADAVEANIRAAGFPCIRKSRNDPAIPDGVVLADTTGELMGFYGISSYVFVGKSLCDHGAQNMIEPCLCGCATFVGPYTENFRPVMSDLLASKALIQCSDEATLSDAMMRILQAPQEHAKLSQHATQAVLHRKGNTQQIALAICCGIKLSTHLHQEKA